MDLCVPFVGIAFFISELRDCFNLCRKFCHGDLRCIPIGCQPDGCRLFLPNAHAYGM